MSAILSRLKCVNLMGHVNKTPSNYLFYGLTLQTGRCNACVQMSFPWMHGFEFHVFQPLLPICGVKFCLKLYPSGVIWYPSGVIYEVYSFFHINKFFLQRETIPIVLSFKIWQELFNHIYMITVAIILIMRLIHP